MKKRSDGLSILQRLHDRGLVDELDEACKLGHVLRSEVLSPVRYEHVCAIRHQFWLALKAKGFSYGEIARLFDRDHTTVMLACRKLLPKTEVPI